MSSNRLVRINEILKQEIATLLYRIINDPGFDHGAVTITRVDISSDLKHAKVYVSVLGDEEKQRRAIGKLGHYRREIQAAMSQHVIIKYTPHLFFELDGSIEKGDHVLDLISKIEQDHPDWVAPMPDPRPAGEEPQ